MKLDDLSWETKFKLTREDVERISNRILKEKRPFPLTELAKRLIRGRFKYGADPSAAVLKKWTGRARVRLWDPASQWEKGDGVIVAFENENGNDEAYVGEVIDFWQDSQGKHGADIHLDLLNQSVAYEMVPPNDENARKWYLYVREIVDKKLGSSKLDQKVDAVLLQHGENIISHLRVALESDPRFISLEGFWYLKEMISELSKDQIQHLYNQLLSQGSIVSLREMAEWLELPEKETTGFTIHNSLQACTDMFANLGSPSHPKWTTIKPPPPPPNKAIARYYVYDPETYQILIEPGQRLTQNLAQRLQALGFYAEVVELAP